MTREQGELVDWRDERGFGFIQRPGDAGRIYVHMKSIGKSVDRPRPGDRMDYAIDVGKDGRPVAVDVRIIGAPPKPPPAPPPAPLRPAHTVLGISTRVVAAAAILALLSANIFMHRLPVWIAVLYLIAGVGSFLLYRADKLAAVDQGWRKPEIRLQLLDLTFGIVGGLFAQHVFRHKTYKAGFVTVTALITALHVMMLGLILFGVYAAGSLGEFFRQLKLPG